MVTTTTTGLSCFVSMFRNGLSDLSDRTWCWVMVMIMMPFIFFCLLCDQKCN